MPHATGDRDVLQSLHNHAAGIVVNIVATAAQIYLGPLYYKMPYYTFILTGEGWVQELLDGHPCQIKTELSMQQHVFQSLVQALVSSGLRPSKHILNEEQVAIFLYGSVTGLSIRHLGKWFQHSNDTISHYYQVVLQHLSSSPFYPKYVHLPLVGSPPPIEIQSNLKFFPFFEGAIGAMDGMHISCCPSAAKPELSCNHKGWMSQNCLACCSFDMLFQYMLSRWDGSAADAAIFNNVQQSDLRVPDG